jgi:molecular chaperone DnaJ
LTVMTWSSLNPMTNYYHTLQVSANASTDEIRKAFRKLALIYHPDKHKQQDIAAIRFAEIYEAYSVLTDKQAREKYDRKLKANKTDVFRQPSTAADILELSAGLQVKLSRLDPFRTDRDLVHFEVLYLLSDRNIKILQTESNPGINRQIITNIIGCAPYLQYNTVREITPALKQLVIEDRSAMKQVELFIRDNARSHFWNRYKVWGALIIALLICLFIFYASRK